MSSLTFDEGCALIRASDITVQSAILIDEPDIELDAFSVASHSLSLGDSDNPEFILIEAETDDIWTDIY